MTVIHGSPDTLQTQRHIRTRYGVQVRKGKDSGKKIDLCVAAIMAWGRAATLGATPAEKPRPKVEFIEL
jgi:phage terminase large subunit-like protein